MYNFVGGMVLGHYVGFFSVVVLGVGTGWEEIIPIGMAPGESYVDYLGNYNDVIGRA